MKAQLDSVIAFHGPYCPGVTIGYRAAIFALQMLLATNAGGLDTRDDWTRWLSDAGFASSQIIQLPGWIGTALTIAEKPLTAKN